MRIEVDRGKCVGDGLCRECAGEVFEIDREIRCAVREAGASDPEDVFFAAWNCPNGCISLYDAESGERLWPGEIPRERFDELARRQRDLMDPDEWAYWRDLGAAD